MLPPFFWYFFLSWHPGTLIENHDGIQVFYLQARELFALGGDWTQLTYRLGVQGGAKIHDILGTLPFLQWAARIGLSPVAGLNTLIFAIQSAFAFLTLQAARDLAILAAPNEEPSSSLTTRIGLATLAAFSPFLGWTLPYGHESHLLGAMFFLVFASLALSVAAQTFTALHALVCLGVLIHAIRGSGQQAVVYSVIFGAPIAIGGFFFVKNTLRSKPAMTALLAAFAVPVAALCIALPGYWGMIANAMGTDFARSSSSGPVTFSYYVSKWQDWLQSLAWTIRAIPQATPTPLHHEINYPIGPLLFIALSFRWKRARGLAIGMLISLGLALCFSTDMFPFSNLLLALLPPLRLFRVPARAILPFLFAVIIVAESALLSKGRENGDDLKKRAPLLLAAGAASIAIALLPNFGPMVDWGLEATAWILAAIVFSVHLRKYQKEGIILLLAGLSLHAFHERMTAHIDMPSLTSTTESIRRSILEQAPDLASPLTRIVLDFTVPPWSTNTPMALGLSSIDGYLQANRRFHDLVDAVRGESDPSGTMMNYHFGNTPAFETLASLYNVRYRATEAQGKPKVVPTHLDRGGAWFASQASPTGSYESLAHELRFWDGKDAWYLQNDPAIRPETRELLSRVGPKEICEKARLIKIEALDPAQGVHIETVSPAPCVLAVAMNFVSSFDANIDRSEKLPVFPIYGALTGIVVPMGHHLIEIRDQAQIPAWTRWLQGFGFVLVIAAFSAWFISPSRL